MSGEKEQTDVTLYPNGNNAQNTPTNTPTNTPKKRGTKPGQLPQKLRERMWEPGKSGNPGGRPQMSPEVKAALAGAALPAIQKQIELMSCGDVRVELMASQALLDRFYGKAVQAVDAQVTTTNVQQAHLQVLVELQQKRDQAMKTIEAGDVNEQGEQKP